MEILMSVVFALTIQSPLFRVKIYKSSLKMLHWPAVKLDMNYMSIDMYC